MEQAASHGDGGAGISGEPWERVVRQIPLAARGDVLDDMASVWSSYVHNLEAFHDRFNKIWDDCLDGRWTGDAADACHQQWRKSAQSITKIAGNYEQMPGLLRHCSASIHEAISTIPIPVFQGGNLPGNLSRGNSGGDGLYQDYQGNRSAYGDYEFLHKALNADSDSYANGVRTRHDGSYRTDLTSAGERNAITDQDDLVRTAAIKRWYAGHQATAHSAREQLLNQYSHTHSASQVQRRRDIAGSGAARLTSTRPRTHLPAMESAYAPARLEAVVLPSVGCLPQPTAAAARLLRCRTRVRRTRSSARRRWAPPEATRPIQGVRWRAVPASTPPATRSWASEQRYRRLRTWWRWWWCCS